MRSARRTAVAGVAVVLAATPFVAYLAWMVREVTRDAGWVAGWLLAGALLALPLALVPSIQWARLGRLLAGLTTSISGALLTIVLGYRLEHPGGQDSTAGGLLATASVAFLITVVAELRIQHLSALSAAAQEQRAHEQHLELLAAVRAASTVRGTPRRTTAARRRAALATVFVLGCVARRARARRLRSR